MELTKREILLLKYLLWKCINTAEINHIRPLKLVIDDEELKELIIINNKLK